MHFRAAILDDRTRKNRVRVVSESAVCLKGTTTTRTRSRLLSESVATSKATEGHSKVSTRFNLHCQRPILLPPKAYHTPSFSLLGHSKVKEERKYVLNVSERKYRDLSDDPEEVLLRYVLVSNAMKNLQIKMRREKAAKRLRTYSASRL